MKKSHILIIDDDPEIQKVVTKYLGDDGYVVYSASTGAESLDILKQKSIDLILLDMILPDADGLDLIAKFHENGKTPIIVVSGKSDATDRIVGLEMGADDYLTKPFHLRELSARIKTVLRRTFEEREAVASPVEGALYFDGYKMDFDKYEVRSRGGALVPLTSGEFKLLHALVSAPGRVLSREQLFDITRDADYDSYDRAVDIQIGRLRKKMGDDPGSPSLIKTVRGVGYMFVGEITKEPDA